MWALRALVAVCLLSRVHAYFFESEYTHHYTYSADLTAYGQRKVTTVLKFQIRHVNETENGHRLHSLHVDSLVQMVEGGFVMENPLKWDLSKTFLFVVNDKGTVTLVHCHQDDHEELLIIKKAMVSVFSVDVQIEEDADEWTYVSTHEDHLGELEHTYKATKTSSGLKLHRTHFSAENAHRYHDKTLHYDQKGTLHTAKVADRVVVKNPNKSSKNRMTLGREHNQNADFAGELPEMEVNGTALLTLDGKRPFKHRPKLSFEKLRVDSLQTKKMEKYFSLSELQGNITDSFNCLKKIPDLYHMNHSACLTSLQVALRKLKHDDYRQFVGNILTHRCGDQDKFCTMKRQTVLEVAGIIGGPVSQELLIQHVLSRNPPIETELQSVFGHCVTVESPSKEFVQAVGKFCFGENDEHHGTRAMTITQRQACLALGSLARNLQRDGQSKRAERLVEKLEQWLVEHAKGDHHVSKRDTWLTDREDDDHHVSKAVLLHALGNAALSRSRRHLLEHAQPNRGHHMWRRAALDAMRHYTCNESGSAMFDAMLNDEWYSVRRQARHVFKNHPKRHHITRSGENALLSDLYSYERVMKVKRAVMNNPRDRGRTTGNYGIEPKNFDKDVGSSDLGGTMEANSENKMSVVARTLDSEDHIDLFDDLGARSRLTIMKYHRPLNSFQACFRGQVKHDVNMVKDFNLETFRDKPKQFSQIAPELFEPLIQATDSLAKYFEDPQRNTPVTGFQQLADAVKRLPEATGSALQATITFNNAINDLNGLPVFTQLKQAASRLQTLAEDVNSEASDLYTALADAAIVVLPHAEKEIRTYINVLLGRIPDAGRTPRQTVAVIRTVLQGYNLALQRVLESNRRIRQATGFLSASRSPFMTVSDELWTLLETSRHFLTTAIADKERQKNETSHNAQQYWASMENTFASVLNAFQAVDSHVEDLMLKVPKPFQIGLDRFTHYMTVLLTHLEAFSKTADSVQSNVTSFLGQKFHPKFPERRRTCDPVCDCGFYPTGMDRYGYPGVDIQVPKNGEVYSPATGMLFDMGNTSVAIIPMTPDFRGHVIILSNIRLSSRVPWDGQSVRGGQVIGYAVGRSGCQQSHVNIALRLTTETETSLRPDDLRDQKLFTDPTPFLDPVAAESSWHEECSDFTTKKLGQTIGFGKLTSGVRKTVHDPQRLFSNLGGNMAVQTVQQPTGSTRDSTPEIADFLTKRLDKNPFDPKKLYQSGGDAAAEFFANVSMDSYRLSDLVSMARGISNTSRFATGVSNMMRTLYRLQQQNRRPAIGTLWFMTVGALNRITSALNGTTSAYSGSGVEGTEGIDLDVLESFEGGRSRLLSSLLISAATSCEKLASSISALSGATCIPHSDCLGINCDIAFTHSLQQDNVQLNLRVSPEQHNVSVNVNGTTHIVSKDAHKTFVTGQRIFANYAITVRITTEWNEDRLRASLSLLPCSPDSCLGQRQILRGVEFSTPAHHRRKRQLGSYNMEWGLFDGELRDMSIGMKGEDDYGFGLSVSDDGFDLSISTPVFGVGFGYHSRETPKANEVLRKIASEHPDIADLVRPMNDIAATTSMSIDLPSGIEGFDVGFERSVEFSQWTQYDEETSTITRGSSTRTHTGFTFSFSFPTVVCLVIISVSAGGNSGVDYNMRISLTNGEMFRETAPWFSYSLSGDLSASIIVASFGITLDFELMKVRVPATQISNIRCACDPKGVRNELDLQIDPVSVRGALHWEVLFFIHGSVTMFHFTLHWSLKNGWCSDFEGPTKSGVTIGVGLDMGALTGQVKALSRYKPKPGRASQPYYHRLAPAFARPSRRRRSEPDEGCFVYQVPGRHPLDPAFVLVFSVANEECPPTRLSYAIGTYCGGKDVLDWTKMENSPLFVAKNLPCNKSLCVTVSATMSKPCETEYASSCNSRDKSSVLNEYVTTSYCRIPSFDCTEPDGCVQTPRCSSHPSVLTANVTLYDDSELLEESVSYAVGYSPGSLGNQVEDWLPLNISRFVPQIGVSGDLKYFGQPRPGRLASSPYSSAKASSASECASMCVQSQACLSFSYNQQLQVCELQKVAGCTDVRGAPDEFFVTYERLGKVYTSTLRLEDLPLRHGVKYYVNTDVWNALGFHSTVSSKGTMVDFSPPEPGPVGEASKDVVTPVGCEVSLLQRCDSTVEPRSRHRTIIDGRGGRTVFNGNRKGQELLFTMENYHLSANWEGFKDDECGLHGYTWAVGTSVCGTDVVDFRDPHVFIRNKNDWTNVGLAKDLQLADGKYYVTVQAVSDIIFGGDHVTTVCHSTPLVIDTSPPQLKSVQQVLFDETFRYLVVYYSASDDISGIASIEFGLGRTKYDVMMREYIPFEIRGVDGNTYIVNEEFETDDGVPAWIRLKVVNNVGMSFTGSSDAPIILDGTAPFPGHVMDGRKLDQDICCQSDDSEICVQWADFYDPDCNIDSFQWGVGLSPGKDDIVAFHSLSSYDKQSCVHVQLEHNVTYFSTIVAFNKALNTKSANATSNGVLVDVTPPVPGTVSDGDDVYNDVNFTSETATLTASWSDFFDPETEIEEYTLDVFVNDDLEKTFDEIHKEQYIDHSFSFHHGDRVHSKLRATNRAGGSVTVSTDGMLVDHTPPEVVHVNNVNLSQYQQTDDVLHFIWKFLDPESGITEFRCTIFELYHGLRKKFWPTSEDFYTQNVNSTSLNAQELRLDGLTLQNGGGYSLKVVALNGAELAATQESDVVTVDVTGPSIQLISLAPPKEEEDVNENDVVVHVEGEPLWVTWVPVDDESGISHAKLCIGLDSGVDCIATDSDVKTVEGSSYSTTLNSTNLLVSTDSQDTLYRVYLVVYNGAGIKSPVGASKPLKLLKKNVAGTVLDGREGDIAFSNDKTSIAMTFSGFSSEACGIEGYEWAIGTNPFSTDIMPYTDFGLVVDDEGNGFAQIDIMQFEGQTYYSSVRAKTGHSCHEDYIVSSSDGFTVDTTPPSVTFTMDALGRQPNVLKSQEVSSHEVVYQTKNDKLSLGWSASDPSGLNQTLITLNAYGPHPVFVQTASDLSGFVLDSPPSSGDTLLSMLVITDKAGNEKRSLLPPVTFDLTPPEVQNLLCTNVVSYLSSLVSCNWFTIEETDSALQKIEFGLGSGPTLPDLLNYSPVPVYSRQWSVDADAFTRSDISEFYVIVRIVSKAGLETVVPLRVINDVTPPTLTSVVVVTSPQRGYHDVEQKCQTSQDYMELSVQGINDTESGIQSVEIALGSSKGTSDVRPFKQYPVVNGLYALGQLGLQTGSTVYATVRVTNAVGLYTIRTSGGVVISPEPRLEVLDGAGDTDMDGQFELHLMQGSWRYSDPCPIVSAEWSLRELGGTIVTNFTAIPGNGTRFYNDSLQLENLKTYVNYVRIRDALGRTFTAYSDGTTVLIRTPQPAVVRDGLGPNDEEYQEATDQLSANWDAFGDARSMLPSDHIVRYEAAVGTDRRFLSTRSDVHAFEDVGLNTTHTFYALNLTTKSATYYVTVRGYSAAGSRIETSSDGIRVGYRSNDRPGKVYVERYQSGNGSIRFSWSDFDSDMGITHYYAGISSFRPSWNNGTYSCVTLFHEFESIFDIHPKQSLHAESTAVIEGLSLTHRGRYHVTVIAEDRMGKCVGSVSDELLVDITPPVQGNVTADGHDAGTVIFLHSDHTVTANVERLLDPESGVKKVTVSLLSGKCPEDKDSDEMTTITSVDAENHLQVTIRGLELQHDTLYYLRVAVTNGAGLETKATSLPLILDTSPPQAGVVKLGTNWTQPDSAFLNQTHTVRGVVALQAMTAQHTCGAQLDLLAREWRDRWKSDGGRFSQDCAGFKERPELHAVVQHNSHLSGVEKGAARFSKLQWREGNHTFVMRAAGGQNILTGISLVSPELKAPFYPGNLLSLPCDSSVGRCNDARNNSTLKTTLNLETDYGVGIAFFDQNGTSKALFWAQDKFRLKQAWISLDFDPSQVQAEYILELKKEELSFGNAWSIAVIVNGMNKGSISGLLFPEELDIVVYTWNINDFVPPVVDPLKPFRSTTTVSSLLIPVKEKPLCSYGSPFYDSRSGLKEIWMGVSDSANDTANVAPYTLIHSFCIPCLMGCSSICSSCSGDSLSSAYDIFSLQLNGLALKAADEFVVNGSALNNSLLYRNSSEAFSPNTTSEDLVSVQLPMYYLSVKVVDHAGLVAESTSAALTVDTSPPVINFVRVFDPEYLPDEQIFFLGNNHTVGVKWDTSEDVSMVKQVCFQVRTQPDTGDVTQKNCSTKQVGEHTFSNISPPLADSKTYYIIVEVRNEAGLVSRRWNNFTVGLSPPDMSAMNVTLPNVTIVAVSGTEVGLLDNTERLELNLDLDPSASGDVDIEYYEWSIGTEPGKDDLFPKTRVGVKGTKKVAMVDGFMQLEGLPGGVSIGDYTKKNLTSDTPPDPSANMFLMEPGRCLKQRLYGGTRAHVVKAIDIPPVCIKRSDDMLISKDNASHTMVLNGKAFSTGTASSPAAKDKLSVKMKLSKGAVMAGVLKDSDLNAQYGSSASTEFSPYIVRPDLALDQTSRLLRKRVEDMPGPHFFLSPLADTEFSEDIEISYVVPSGVGVPTDSSVTVLFWSPDAREWQSPEELCPMSSVSYDNSSRTVTVKLCSAVFAAPTTDDPRSSRVSKRSASSLPPPSGSKQLGPRMLTVAVIASQVVNESPVIRNTSFAVLEDGGQTKFTISYTDDENDAMVFTLVQQPRHGHADVTPDGELTYQPDTNFNGVDVIYLKGREIPSIPAAVPNTVLFNITVTISSVNDPPDIFYLAAENSSEINQELLVGPEAGNGVNMSVFIEGNTTTYANLGIIVYSDVDPSDNVTYINTSRVSNGAEFILKDMHASDPRLQRIIPSSSSGTDGKEISLNLPKGFSGHVVYDARVKDAAGSFSMQLTLGVHVLINPCFHGSCEPRAQTDTCHDPQRAFSFEPYSCKCDVGYEGQWCETDTNDCASATCSPITDCVDLVGGHRCDYNPAKLAAIIVCCVLAVVLIVVAIFRLTKRSSKVEDCNRDWIKTLDATRTISDVKCTSAETKPEPQVVEPGLEPKLVDPGLELLLVEPELGPHLIEPGLEPQLVETGREPGLAERGFEPELVESGLEPQLVQPGRELQPAEVQLEPQPEELDSLKSEPQAVEPVVKQQPAKEPKKFEFFSNPVFSFTPIQNPTIARSRHFIDYADRPSTFSAVEQPALSYKSAKPPAESRIKPSVRSTTPGAKSKPSATPKPTPRRSQEASKNHFSFAGNNSEVTELNAAEKEEERVSPRRDRDSEASGGEAKVVVCLGGGKDMPEVEC